MSCLFARAKGALQLTGVEQAVRWSFAVVVVVVVRIGDGEGGEGCEEKWEFAALRRFSWDQMAAGLDERFDEMGNRLDIRKTNYGSNRFHPV